MEEGDKSLDAASSSELPGRKVGMVTWHGASGANAQSKILLASIIHPFHSTSVLLLLSTSLTLSPWSPFSPPFHAVVLTVGFHFLVSFLPFLARCCSVVVAAPPYARPSH